MNIGSVFENNRTQAVRLPADARFPKNVKRVSARVIGQARMIEPLGSTWDTFFHPEAPNSPYWVLGSMQNRQ